MSFSVLVSVYKEEVPDYLNQAMSSIWDEQTLKPDQIVLVKDGPLAPELESEILKWREKLGDVLCIVGLPHNIGLGAALNEGLKSCKWEIVARMDTDDIALPERFEKQYNFMHLHPEIAASSASLEEWDESMERCIGKRILPTGVQAVRKFAKKRSPLSHPLVMFRKSKVLDAGGYPPLRKAQDYALWSLMLTKGYQLDNLPDTLLKMRTGNKLHQRRGLGHLKHEIKLMAFQKRVGFLGFFDFFWILSARFVLRLSPVCVKRLAYKYFR